MRPPGPAEADARLWAIVTATVRPLSGRGGPRPPGGVPGQAAGGRSADPAPGGALPLPQAATPAGQAKPILSPPPEFPARTKPASRPPAAPAPLEPGRRRRLERGRDTPAGVIDLHGLDQDQARDALTRFVMRAVAERRRTVLVITGKGALGDGVLRRRVPEWLGQAPLRPLIAGHSEAHRRHGGEGALYVALRRG